MHSRVSRGCSHDKTALIERGRALLEKIPTNRCGNGTCENDTFHAACELVKELCIPVEDAFDLLREWCDRGTHDWTDEKVLKKLRDADASPGERGRKRDATYTPPRTAEQIALDRDVPHLHLSSGTYHTDGDGNYLGCTPRPRPKAPEPDLSDVFRAYVEIKSQEYIDKHAPHVFAAHPAPPQPAPPKDIFMHPMIGQWLSASAWAKSFDSYGLTMNPVCCTHYFPLGYYESWTTKDNEEEIREALLLVPYRCNNPGCQLCKDMALRHIYATVLEHTKQLEKIFVRLLPADDCEGILARFRADWDYYGWIVQNGGYRLLFSPAPFNGAEEIALPVFLARLCAGLFTMPKVCGHRYGSSTEWKLLEKRSGKCFPVPELAGIAAKGQALDVFLFRCGETPVAVGKASYTAEAIRIYGIGDKGRRVLKARWDAEDPGPLDQMPADDGLRWNGHGFDSTSCKTDEFAGSQKKTSYNQFDDGG